MIYSSDCYGITDCGGAESVTASPDREQPLTIVPLYVEYNVSSYSEWRHIGGYTNNILRM